MEYSPFRLLVYAVVFLAVVFIIMQLFFFKSEKLVDELKLQLNAAEAKPGMVLSKKIFLEDGISLESKILNSDKRTVTFRCNKPNNCTVDKIKVDSTFLQTIKPQDFSVSFRCITRFSLNECMVFFGQLPAQIRLVSFETEKELFDLDQENVKINFSFADSGDLNALDCSADLAVSIEATKQGIKTAEEYFPKKTIYLGNVGKGEKKTHSIELALADEGKFFVELGVFCPEAGYEKKTISFSTKLSALSKDCKVINSVERIVSDQNIVACFCKNCNFAFECMDACKEFNPDYVFESISNEESKGIKPI
ncbi:MAG: hypothetical protein ABIA76_02825 [Candidatus Diapherotrites archaeon]